MDRADIILESEKGAYNNSAHHSCSVCIDIFHLVHSVLRPSIPFAHIEAPNIIPGITDLLTALFNSQNAKIF